MTSATRGFARSGAMLAKAIRRHAPGPIPFGLGLVPALGVPHYFKRASGALLEDVDGNRLIDLHAGSGAVLLGHAAPEVTKAVTRILRDGLVGVPTRLEAAVAERLVALRPWAQRVRFAKTGSEAVSLAVRLARAYTGRELLAVAGYHGWHDTVIGGVPGQRGIPKALRRLCLGFRAVDPDFLGGLLGRHHRQFAAVLLEPARPWPPDVDVLNAISERARRDGALVIHDEITSGLRSPAVETLGAQTPDLTILGKTIGNGFPLAAVLGGRDVIGAADPSLLLVSAATHDTASLAATEATLDSIARQDVVEALARSDTELRHQLIRSIQRFGLTDQLGVGGYPGLVTLETRGVLPVPPDAVRLLLVQELLARAVYCLGPIFPSRQHDAPVLGQVRLALDQIVGILETALREQNGLRQILRLEVPERTLLRRRYQGPSNARS
jgi:glutamate-1-semialdehyde 2,1-aminomutase